MRKVNLGKVTNFCPGVGGAGGAAGRGRGVCDVHSWNSPPHLQQHRPLGDLLAKASVAARGGKGHVWPCDRQGRDRGTTGTHTRLRFVLETVSAAPVSTRQIRSHLLEEKTNNKTNKLFWQLGN